MKVTYKIIATGTILLSGLLSSCSLDEFNPSTVDMDIAYKYRDGYESLVNYCYDGLYYFYGKIDGVGPMEMGTDLWVSESKESAYALYDSKMNTTLGTIKTIWQGFYSTVNYCNTAIYYADIVKGYTDEERNAKVAEAYFLRAWSNWHLVEQFGGVVLRKEPSTVTGPDNYPKRSTEVEFYDLIIEDLKFACQHLPYTQGAERGRVTKKAAYAMLAKAYLQRTRLGESNASEYARLALEAAKELIDNPSKYGCALYASDAEKSGFAKLWDGENNKNNTEFLFIEAVDHDGFKNPEGNNRGRTRQYYLMDLKTVGAEWGTAEKNCAWYSRANDRGFKPTRFLMTEIFPPVENPADTRFEETFFIRYFNSLWVDKTINQAMVDKYGKDPSLVGWVIKNTAGTMNNTDVYYGGRNYYCCKNCSGQTNMVDLNGDGYLDGLSVYTPNWTILAGEKRMLPFLCVDPSDMFDSSGKWVTATTSAMGTYYKECYPSLRKFSSLYWIYDNQKWEGDVPIIRLGEVYLLAAEAALRYNNDQASAAALVNTIRQRAAVTGRASEMTVNQGDVTLDFILAERARETAGEQYRWYDLKRFGKLTNAYLGQTNPDILNFDEAKHKVRPIPQSFLDAIANPEEFGSNGY